MLNDPTVWMFNVYLCQKHAFTPIPHQIRVNHFVISFRSVPLPPPCSNAEQIIWSSRSKACLCPHPTQNQMQSESLGHLVQKRAFAPIPLQMQSKLLGHLCQKHAFAPTLLKCRVNHLVTSVKSIPLPLPC